MLRSLFIAFLIGTVLFSQVASKHIVKEFNKLRQEYTAYVSDAISENEFFGTESLILVNQIDDMKKLQHNMLRLIKLIQVKMMKATGKIDSGACDQIIEGLSPVKVVAVNKKMFG